MKINYPRLFELVRDGQLEPVMESIQEYKQLGLPFDPHFCDKYKRNILHWACHSAYDEIVQYLLKLEKWNLEEIDSLGYTALELAVLNEYLNHTERLQSLIRIVDRLLSSGAVLNGVMNGYESVLHWACYFGNKPLIEMIIDKRIDFLMEECGPGWFPVDYLFLDNKLDRLKHDNKLIFQMIVRKMKQTNESDYGRSILITVFFRTIGSPLMSHQSLLKRASIIDKLTHNQKFLRKNRPPLLPLKNYLIYSAQSHGGSPLKASKILSEKLNRRNQKQNRLDANENQGRLEMLRKIELKAQQYTKILKIPKQLIPNLPVTIINYRKAYKQNVFMRLQCRMLFWSAHLDDLHSFEYFLRQKCSPFFLIYNGHSALHAAAQMGSVRILNRILKSDYITDCSDDNNNLQIVKSNVFINTLSENQPSTPLHLAIENEYLLCAKMLIDHGASTEIVNFRNLKPFQLTFNEKMKAFYDEYFSSSRDDNFYEKGFFYAIQTRSKAKIEDDIVYVQMLNLKERFREEDLSFEFLVVYGQTIESVIGFQQDGISRPHHSYYVIKLTHDTIYKLAARFNCELYHLKNKTIQKFEYNQRNLYEFPKHMQIQKMVMDCLEEEFEVEKFMIEGLLLQHFPIQDTQQREQMLSFWDESLHACIMDNLSTKTNQLALRPLHSMTIYYGPVIGWYFAFLVQLVGWLTIPSVIGLGIGCMFLVTFNLNSPIILFYALFIALWATVFLESWKRRENELSFTWDIHQYRKHESIRILYQGQYQISNLRHQPEVFDKFTTFKRRCIVDIPIILLGIIINVANFWIFLSLSEKDFIKNSISYRILFSSINGMVMTALKEFYKLLVTTVVQWENHKYDSEQQFSYIMKLFLFEFMNSYILLIYQAVILKNPKELGISVASITITRGIIQNFRSNLIPLFKNIYYQRIRKAEYEKLKGMYCSGKNYDSVQKEMVFLFKTQEIQSQQNEDGQRPFTENLVSTDRYRKIVPPLTNQDHFQGEKLNIVQQLELLQQLESRNFKQDQKPLIDEYTDLAIQFGYITMFATAFPPAPIFFMLNCYINLRFSLHNYANVMKREQAQASEGIGIWLNIFTIMGYAATLMNCVLTALTYTEQLDGLIGGGSTIRNVFILAAIEHLILLTKYIVSELIDDQPKWVQQELERANYIRNKLNLM